jgi:hypothetical protein
MKSGASQHGICARCYGNNSECESMDEQEAFVDMARSADLGARVNAHAAGGASIVRTWRCATKDERGLQLMGDIITTLLIAPRAYPI